MAALRASTHAPCDVTLAKKNLLLMCSFPKLDETSADTYDATLSTSPAGMNG
eukprot:CAMPEP_0184727324 /NCGR_PEP_ID=MMETSP0314-20130426/36206_1 /TAXON_ID=38298 /ORGANISM="Rhodella maculata, Strain CCMP 736" /LENGTH=51 /DNA_ID=CAMNT_0027192901 /DNA_START=265 /DNA_END=420 /DNA_ORIENTATION=-